MKDHFEDGEALISIVDDEACVREAVGSLIRSAGFKTKEYASAEDFLTWGWWEEPACLILDLHLPAMGGLHLQQYLAEKQRDRPTVFISGDASENEEIWATMRGAVAFLHKPFSDESLLEAVRASMKRSRHSFKTQVELPGNDACPLCREAGRAAKTRPRSSMEPVDGTFPQMDNTLS